ncbi:MAG: hypothetical protein ACMV1B_01300 [Prevotella sp.]
MAQQYDPVTWRNVAMPDNQASLIKMAADRSNLLNDVINSFQSRDKQILDRNVSNLNAMETYNTKEQSAKIIQALSGVANPSADGARVLADTINRLDPNMPINKAELYDTGFNAINRLTEGVKNGLGIQQTQNELAVKQGKINASTQSLVKMGVLPQGTQPDPSHVALYEQTLQQMAQANSDTTANAAAMNAGANVLRANTDRVESHGRQQLNDLNIEATRLKLEELQRKLQVDTSLVAIRNALNSDGDINQTDVENFKKNGGNFPELVKLGTDKYFDSHKDLQAVVNQSDEVNKLVNNYQARSGGASAEEMDVFYDSKSSVRINMTRDVQQILLKNGYNSDNIREATERVFYLARGIVDHKNATEYNHNLFKPSGNEATDPEKVVRAAALEAANLFVSQGLFSKQAQAAQEAARAFSMNKLLGKN